MKTLGAFNIGDVLPHTVDDNPGVRAYHCNGKVWYPHMHSLRYSCFKKHGLRCVKCGIVGALFLLQIGAGDKRPHFNLYAISSNNRLILMTRDHIVPRSLGGANRLWNLQTMCTRCNNKKGDKIELSWNLEKWAVAMEQYLPQFA